jgi:predicted RNase H-like HicB family nuclease
MGRWPGSLRNPGCGCGVESRFYAAPAIREAVGTRLAVEAWGSMKRLLTAIIAREGDGFVSLCPELDIASQGDTVESARDNLREALELFFGAAPPEEVEQRLCREVFVTQVEVAGG